MAFLCIATLLGATPYQHDRPLHRSKAPASKAQDPGNLASVRGLPPSTDLRCAIAHGEISKTPLSSPLPPREAAGREGRSLVVSSLAASTLGLGGIHRRAADDLAHFTGLLRQCAHLRLHIFAMQL